MSKPTRSGSAAPILRSLPTAAYSRAPSTRREVPGGVTRISSETGADVLAARLRDPARDRPVVVISVAGGRREPWVDAASVESAVRGLADVVVISDAASWRLTALLPEKTQVYGGAGRAYPVGAAWEGDPGLAPLRFAYDAGDGPRVTDVLIHDALEMVARACAARAAAPTTLGDRQVRGQVRRLVEPSRALVQLDDGEVVTIWSELTAPGVTIDRLVRPGQVVTGLLDADARRLDVRGMRQADPGVTAYQVGSVVLAEVRSVRQDVAHLALSPERVVPVPRDRVTTNPHDRLTALFTEGEVVLARVAWLEGDRVFLRLDDVDDGETALPAPPVLAGGPPWLTPPVREAGEVEDVLPAPAVATTPQPEDPSARPGGPSAQPGDPSAPGGDPSAPGGESRPVPTPRDVSAGRSRPTSASLVRALQQRARELDARVLELETKVRQQRTALRRATVRHQSEARPRPAGVSLSQGIAFLDPTEQFRHEVYMEWVRRIPASQKSELALAPYSLGPEFLGSLAAVDGVERSKVAQVAVEVLTGLADRLDGREKHRLRTSASGGSPPVTRDGGGCCWRVALQRGTPAARRLHVWQVDDAFEFSRVVTHDDMRP